MTKLRSIAFIAFSLLAAVAAPAWAQTLPTLTVTSPSGTVTVRVGKVCAPWNEGIVDFEGVPFSVILDKAGAEGTMATVIALNDYSVDIPVSDFADFNVILAVKRDGDYMPVDDQGPYFVMYPFDANPVLQKQPYYGRAVWQVKAVSVE